MENQTNGCANGHDTTDEIQPELISDDRQQSETFSLDDIATDADDIPITGDSVLDHVEVRKPYQQEWFQVHKSWSLSTRAVIIKIGAKETVYLLHKRLMPCSEALEQDSVPVLVCVCINTKGKIFIWVVRKGKDDGALSKYYMTTREHIKKATTNWIRHFWLGDQGRHAMRVAQFQDKPQRERADSKGAARRGSR
jgi:hypothetical protein